MPEPPDIRFEQKPVKDLTFQFEMDAESRKSLEKFMAESVKQQIEEFEAKVWACVEDICRTLVKPVIKGEITKGKIRWRGLALLFDETGTAFYGVLQHRHTLYTPNKMVIENVTIDGPHILRLP